MNRSEFISGITVLAGASLAGRLPLDAPSKDTGVLTIAHITDVHIREGDNAPERFKSCLRQIITKHQPNLFLNTGDSINDASYDNVNRESVTQQWALWDDCIKTISKYELHSCIGNHDIWWKAPDTSDTMYGKNYAAKRLNIPNRYYTFRKQQWHFFILDGNNKDISLDEAQFSWLEQELAKVPEGSYAVMMSHYPILGTTQVLVGGGHADHKKLKDLFYKHHNKVKLCLSGHNHLSDKTIYNDVMYCCNGAMSGYWWGKGDKESAGPGFYLETPPGYAILKLHPDGRVENQYFAHQL